MSTTSDTLKTAVSHTNLSVMATAASPMKKTSLVTAASPMKLTTAATTPMKSVPSATAASPMKKTDVPVAALRDAPTSAPQRMAMHDVLWTSTGAAQAKIDGAMETVVALTSAELNGVNGDVHRVCDCRPGDTSNNVHVIAGAYHDAVHKCTLMYHSKLAKRFFTENPSHTTLVVEDMSVRSLTTALRYMHDGTLSISIGKLDALLHTVLSLDMPHALSLVQWWMRGVVSNVDGMEPEHMNETGAVLSTMGRFLDHVDDYTQQMVMSSAMTQWRAAYQMDKYQPGVMASYTRQALGLLIEYGYSVLDIADDSREVEEGRVPRFTYNMVCFSVEWLAEHGYSEFGQWSDAVFLLGHIKLDTLSVLQLAYAACAGDQLEVDIAPVVLAFVREAQYAMYPALASAIASVRALGTLEERETSKVFESAEVLDESATITDDGQFDEEAPSHVMIRDLCGGTVAMQLSATSDGEDSAVEST